LQQQRSGLMSTKRTVAALFFLFVFAGSAMAKPGEFTITNARRVCTNGVPSLTFDWTPSSGATSYSILRNDFEIGTTTGTSFADTAVISGESYTYVVVASDATPNKTRSNSVTMTAPYCTPPDPPALTATVICQSATAAVRLTWTAAARAESYDVYRNGIAIRTNLPASTTSIVDTNVTVGTTYSYFVRPMNVGTIAPQPPPTSPSDSNTETLTVTNPCPPPPAPPSVTSSSSCTTSAGLPAPKVTVTWTAPAGATSYSLYRDDQFVVSTSATTYDDLNVTAGATYTYKVYAQGEGGQSVPGTTTITVPQNVCTPPPAAPTLQASSVCTPSNTAAVQLTWSSAANATSYTVFRNGTSIATGLTSTSFQDAPAVGATYTYVVRAVNGSGTADSSPVTLNHTDVCPRPPGAFSSSVSVFCSNGAPAVRVTWTTSAGATSYSVLRNGTVIASGLTGSSYDDTSVADGSTYSYVVRATNSVGTSETAPGNVTVVDPCPRPPGAFALTGRSFCNGTAATVHLSWTAAPRVVTYSVVRNGATIAANITDMAYDDTDVVPGTGYTYVVRALNANGSTDSNPFSVTPGSCNVTTPRPDLAVSGVTLSPSTANAGDTISVTYTVTNEGAAGAGETQTRIRVGDTLVFGTALPPIAAGASRTETHAFVVPSLRGGAYTVIVSVNDDRAVDELTFGNNTGAGTLEIAESQCQLSCLVSAPTRAVVGQTVRLALLQPPSCPVVVTWQFGNGTMAGGESATTSYPRAGVYNWTVVVNGSGGASCANAGTIEVTAPATSRRRAVRH
jgi:fibronectin type 3 domain-containing protein